MNIEDVAPISGEVACLHWPCQLFWDQCLANFYKGNCGHNTCTPEWAWSIPFDDVSRHFNSRAMSSCLVIVSHRPAGCLYRQDKKTDTHSRVIHKTSWRRLKLLSLLVWLLTGFEPWLESATRGRYLLHTYSWLCDQMWRLITTFHQAHLGNAASALWDLARWSSSRLFDYPDVPRHDLCYIRSLKLKLKLKFHFIHPELYKSGKLASYLPPSTRCLFMQQCDRAAICPTLSLHPQSHSFLPRPAVPNIMV